MKKSFFIVCLFLLGLFGLTACSSNSATSKPSSTEKTTSATDHSPSNNPTAANQEGTLNKLKQAGVIQVGSTPTGPPFTFLNPKTNQVEGIMVDVANKVGEQLGIKMNINPIQFSALIPSIESKKIDMISAGMLITDDRKKVIDFSEPVYSYGEALVVSNDNNSIKTSDDLKGKNVGAQDGTIYLKNLQQISGIQAKGYKSVADMITELKNGRIDAFFGDYPIVAQMLKENPNFPVKIVMDYKPRWVADIGIGFPKGADDFEKAVNETLKKMKTDGEIDKILKKWGLNP